MHAEPPTTPYTQTIARPASAAIRGLNVVLIAPTPFERELLTLTVERLGCDVASADRHPEGVDLTQLIQPDVVILAGAFPEGFTAAQQILQRAGWRKPFLVGLADPKSPIRAEEARAAGLHLFAQKPVDTELLVRLLHRFRILLADIEGFDPAI